jgi:hypothetical protein
MMLFVKKHIQIEDKEFYVPGQKYSLRMLILIFKCAAIGNFNYFTVS